MVNTSCIGRYIDTCDPVVLKANIKNLVKGAPGGPSFPILYFAVERNSPEILSMLCEAGADPSQKYRPSDLATAPMPLLAYTILRAEYDMSDTTDSLVALVAKDADPEDVPKDMWHDYLKAPLKDKADLVDAANAPDRWCTQEVREALCRNLTLLQRYILWKAGRIMKPSPRAKHYVKVHEVMPLFETPYNIIGQQQATTKVIEWIKLHNCSKKDGPLILLFTGPVGMEGMAGQKKVIFLDEFDKTTDEVRKAMLLLFESGQCRDRRENNRIVDSRRLRTSVKNAIGAPLTGRIIGFVPFLPFVEAEQAVVAYKSMREMWHTFRKPINTSSGNLKGHAFVHFVDDGKIAMYLAKKGYDIDLGARSLDRAVDQNILGPFVKAFDQHGSEVIDKMNLRPLENYEIRLVNELSGNSVVVERVGFRASRHRNRRNPSSDIWDTLELGPVVRDFERRVLSRPGEY